MQSKDTRDLLKKQITDAAGNVVYTNIAHWERVNRLKKQFKRIKVGQIVLTSISTGGFLASIIAGIPWLSWLGGMTSAIALGLNLYMLNFNINEDIKRHTDAANELWDIREAYKSLVIDFDDLDTDQIRRIRDELTAKTSEINKNYPETDNRSFKLAQKRIDDYNFAEGESEKLI